MLAATLQHRLVDVETIDAEIGHPPSDQVVGDPGLEVAIAGAGAENVDCAPRILGTACFDLFLEKLVRSGIAETAQLRCQVGVGPVVKDGGQVVHALHIGESRLLIVEHGLVALISLIRLVLVDQVSDKIRHSLHAGSAGGRSL